MKTVEEAAGDVVDLVQRWQSEGMTNADIARTLLGCGSVIAAEARLDPFETTSGVSAVMMKEISDLTRASS